MTVSWLIILMVYLRLPGCVGTPPPDTTMVLPSGVFALSTATRRVHPPEAVAVTVTVGEPNTSKTSIPRGAERTKRPEAVNVTGLGGLTGPPPTRPLPKRRSTIQPLRIASGDL